MGSGFRFEGLGFWVQGLGFRFEGLKVTQNSGSWESAQGMKGSGLRLWSSGLSVGLKEKPQTQKFKNLKP